MDATMNITLQIPASELESVKWIQEQSPEVTATVLSLGESAYRCVQRESTSADVAAVRRKHWEESDELNRKISELSDGLHRKTQESEEALRAAQRQEQTNITRAINDETERCKLRYESELAHERDLFNTQCTRKSTEVETANSRIVELEEVIHTKALSFENRMQEIRTDSERKHEELLEQELAKSNSKMQQLEHTQELERLELMKAFEKRLDTRDRLHKDEAKEMEGSLSALRGELEGWHGKEAKIRLEECERQNVLFDKAVMRLKDEQKAERERTIADGDDKARALKESIAEQSKILYSEMEYHKTQAEHLRDSLRSQSETYAASLERYARPVISVSEVGKGYERLVFNTFANMRPMGELIDTSGNKQEGFADYDWNYIPREGGCPLNALVEIKATMEIHSTKDKEKFERDVAAGTKSGRINAAILISLRCRVQNTNRIDLQISPYGIPLMTVSKDSEDGFECEELVKMCFVTFAQMWPILCKQRQTEGGMEATLGAVVSHLNDEIDSIARISKEIDAIFKTQDSIRNSLNRMKKEKDRMKDRVENLRLNYHTLNVDTLVTVEDEGAPDEGDIEELQQHILEYKSKKDRFPPTFVALAKSAEKIAPNLAICFPASLAKCREICRRAAEDKKQQTVEKKRKLACASAGKEDDGDK